MSTSLAYFLLICSSKITRLSVGAFVEALCTQLEDRARNERYDYYSFTRLHVLHIFTRSLNTDTLLHVTISDYTLTRLHASYIYIARKEK